MSSHRQPSSDNAALSDGVHVSPSLHWSQGAGWTSVEEPLAVEAPLAIELAYERGGQEIRKVLAVTMRTPGHDEELAFGFLFAEGLINSLADVTACTAATENARGENVSTQRVRLARPPREDLQRVSRGLLTSSACGLCGRVSLEGLPTSHVSPRASDNAAPVFACETLARLPDELRRHQPIFFATGGSHGAALCDARGMLHLAREDVGRHNAVDKLVGAALQRRLDLSDKVLVLSGRASFELLQKTAAAGIPLVLAVGAPSSLAVALAHEAGITLVGFTREGRFNVYAHASRINFVETPAKPQLNHG
jgi:FdhD protein